MSTDSDRAAGAAAALVEHEVTVLLVDDQPMIGEAVRRMLASEKDIRFHFCSDPSQAIDRARAVSPTVILQDLVMPDVDGLTLVKFFRANPATRDIPLIVLSSKEEPAVKAEAFGLGANDYLVKLPDRIELIARIRHHSRGYINLLQRNEVHQALVASQKRLAAELSEAAEYVRSLLPEPLNDTVTTDWRFVSSTSLGGDAFGYHWLDADNFAMYLLDVCGHGVGAALLSISAMEVLRSQTLTDTDYYNPSDVLRRLNEAFQMEQHNNMYFTIWYGVYNSTQHRIVYATGGHPAAILLSGESGSRAGLHALKTEGFIIGGMPGMTYQNATAELQEFSKLYIFSDGAYEITRPDGTMWDYGEFLQLLQQPAQPGTPDVERIYRYVKYIHGSDDLEDDFSMLEVVFSRPA